MHIMHVTYYEDRYTKCTQSHTTKPQGVTAAEMSEVFHNGKLKLQWDHTIEADKKLETLDDYCAVYHQILKRVWPTAQRDLVYASHKQKVSLNRFSVLSGMTPKIV